MDKNFEFFAFWEMNSWLLSKNNLTCCWPSDFDISVKNFVKVTDFLIIDVYNSLKYLTTPKQRAALYSALIISETSSIECINSGGVSTGLMGSAEPINC